MRVLFIGGTGLISTACSRLATQRGIDLTLLNRGVRKVSVPDGVRTICADIEDPAAVAEALGKERFDSVVDWIAFTPAQVERDIRLFSGRAGQYIFISSASCYQKPPAHYLITESTPLANPYWQYSRDKIACEELLIKAYRETGFPATIVRPSLTYGDIRVPLAINSWQKSYTLVDRMRRGVKLIVPGDGTSLWCITHNSDFAKGLIGLLGHPQAIGDAFHITSDEVMSWNQYYNLTAEAAGTTAQLVHIPSDLISACYADELGGLIGDKSASAVFDNSKIKRYVPGYCATTPFTQGIRETIAWFDANPARQVIDHDANARWDKLIEAWDRHTGEITRELRA